MTWRLHVFTGIDGVPGAVGPGTVVMLQISHALGGGGRTSAHAAMMFGRVGRRGAGDQPAVGGAARAADRGFSRGPRPSSDAGRHRRGKRSATSGPATAAPNERQAVGAARPAHGGPEACRTRWRDGDGRRAVGGVHRAGRTSRALGEDPSLFGAEVPMAKQPPRLAYNHFGNVGVGLYPELARRCAPSRIAADLDTRRRRAAHPAMRAADLAFAATPAPLLRWGMDRFDPDVRSWR